MIPVAAGVLVGERLTPMTSLGIALAIVAIVLVSQQETAASAPVRAGALPPGVGIALASGVAIGLCFLALAVLPSSNVGEESLSPNHPDTSSRC